MRGCLVDYINYKIANNKNDFICPIDKCGKEMYESCYKSLLGVNTAQLNVVNRNLRIIRSNGNLIACPTVDCVGELNVRIDRKLMF